MITSAPSIYLARHCKTQWNLEGLIQGSVDKPLCPEGVAQAEASVPELRAYALDAIVASPYKRACQTAEIYAKALGLAVATHPGLRELDHGDWEGLGLQPLQQDPHSDFSRWMRDPAEVLIPGGGETVTQAQERAVQAMVDIVGQYPDRRVLVVMHKHIRALLACRLNECPLAAFASFISDSSQPQPVEPTQLSRILPPS